MHADSAAEIPVKYWVAVVAEGQLWRLVESSSGELVDRWLPTDSPEAEPLDRGGWSRDQFLDAVGFSYGVLWCRASGGWLPGVRTTDIDKVRRELDTSPPRQPRKQGRGVTCAVYARAWADTDPGRDRLMQLHRPEPKHYLDPAPATYVRLSRWRKIEPSANSRKVCECCGRLKRDCWVEVNRRLVLGQSRAARGFSW